MKRKRKPISTRDRCLFLLFWSLGWLLISSLASFESGGFLSAEPLSQFRDPIILGASFTIFALWQRHLLQRYLRIDARRWLLWTLLGFGAGQIVP